MTFSAPVVSVVVPIYKVERYLVKCVDSILAQTLREIEVILVDDGSPDACPALCDAYAARDPRVRVIHQENGGYGKAVNTGIATATAPYIGIIESDDWIEPTMYEKLLRRAEETGADVVKCMFWKYDSHAEEGEQDERWDGKTQNLGLAPDGAFKPVEWQPLFFYHASLWSNLYRAELLKQVRFVETPGAAYQDFPFIMEVYAKARKVSIVKEPLLHYRMEAGQGSSTMANDRRLLRMPAMTLAARQVYDNNYFNDAYQGIPIGGYNRLTEALLEGIECRVNEDFFARREYWESVADKIVFTGKIDEFYGYRFGKLEYRTVTFEHEELDTPNHQGCAVVNYTERHIPYTRIIEHKHFEDFGDDVYSKPVTVISREYSTEWTEGSEPFYPVNDEANSVLYQQYKALADAESNVIFGGRLAEYKYYDMAPVIEQALKHFI